MKHLPPSVLAIEGLIFFYKYFFTFSFFGKSTLDLILGVIFLILAFFMYKNNKNRPFQWTTIIFSVFFGPGGFMGYGGLAALILAVLFYLLSKKTK